MDISVQSGGLTRAEQIIAESQEARRLAKLAVRERKRKNKRAWYAKHAEHCRAVSKAWKDRNPEQVRKNKRSWAKANPEKRISGQLKVKYGITLEERDAMLAAQGGKCATCPATEPGTKKGWHTDHQHEPFKLRGILCHHCNVSLGAAKDNTDRLRALADYVERHR